MDRFPKKEFQMAGELKISDFNTNQNMIVVTDTNSDGNVDAGDTAVAIRDFDGYAVGDPVSFTDAAYSTLRTGVRNGLLSFQTKQSQISRLTQHPALTNNGFTGLRLLDTDGAIYVYHRNSLVLPFGAILTASSPQSSKDHATTLNLNTATVPSPASDEAYIDAIFDLARQSLKMENVEILEKAIQKANKEWGYDSKFPRSSIYYDDSTKCVHYPNGALPISFVGDATELSAAVNFAEIKGEPCKVRAQIVNLNGTTQNYVIDLSKNEFSEG